MRPLELSFGAILKAMSVEFGFLIETLFSLKSDLSPIGKYFSKS